MSRSPRAVCAPAVGWWSDHPAPGSWVGPGSRLGVLRCLNTSFVLRLAPGAGGRVERGPAARRVAVGFGEPLFHLRELGDLDAAGERGASDADLGASGLAAGTHAVVAPTDGVFYRCPSPESPPFVEVGSRIRAGQAVGLVEVMKTFNQILYGGPGLPDEAEVVEIRVEEADEVNAGQVLVVVR